MVRHDAASQMNGSVVMEEESFENRRKHPRYPLDKKIHVINRATNESLGVIANLSEGGLMLVHRSPLPADGIYQLAIELEPGVIANKDMVTIELGVDCLWNSPAAQQQADAYWSGCEIIDISDQHLGLLVQLIAAVRPLETR
ncbi:MAG: PilZ domain-containing protein [Gammaproteobacteria bacterium]|nr:MAG: PilZ domain-containing protein [Gammaproteobacteria bacterium]